MKFYTQNHMHYCGIDLHARSMYICILSQDGKILAHRNTPASPEHFLKVVAPFREDLAVAVECIFTWYWLADLCQREGIRFVLGHALYMKAIHGGKAKNDKIDSHKIAVLLHGGTLAQAYVYPPELRATRDLLRRRNHLVNKRAELLTHIQNTNSQYNLAPFCKKIDRKSNRDGIIERFDDPSVQRSMALNLALIDTYDQELASLELYIVRTAKACDANTYYRLRSVPGIGKILALVILYEIHDISRFEKVGNFLSYARLVKCSKESAGKRYGTSGSKIGNVHLRWVFGEAACLFLRNNPEGKRLHEKLVKKHGKAKALSILAQKLGRAVYFMLKRKQAFDKIHAVDGGNQGRRQRHFGRYQSPHGNKRSPSARVFENGIAASTQRTGIKRPLLPLTAASAGRPDFGAIAKRRQPYRGPDPKSGCTGIACMLVVAWKPVRHCCGL